MRTGGSQRRCHSEEKSSAKFVQGDVSGAVRKLESVEGLAHQNGDTLRALKKMHPCRLPFQLGVGTGTRYEAAAHAARHYISDSRHRSKGSFWRSTCALHWIFCRGTRFDLWLMLKHLAITVFCGRLTPFQPDYSLARRALPQRQAFNREAQLDPPSLL